MNHRDRVLLAFCLTSFALIHPAFAQTSIPTALKSASGIDDSAAGQIKSFVGEQAKKLADSGPDAQKAAREALVEASHNGAADASAAYSAKYAEVVSAELMDLLASSKDIRVRLNAAIVAARVAEASKNSRMEKIVLLLLDQKQPEALQLWGMKAARWTLPELIKVNAHKHLLDAVQAAVAKHPSSPMVQEAYETLTPAKATGQTLTVVIDPLLNLTSSRIDGYKAGLPEDPVIDQIPFFFLTAAAIWRDPAFTQAQKVRTMQLMCDLLTLAARNGDAKANPTVKEQCRTIIAGVTAGLFVAASAIPDNNLADVAKKANSAAGSATPKLEDIVAPICPAIKNSPGFGAVQLPNPAP
jgi:hypothetical protein